MRELSSSELLQSELLRIRGKYAQAETLAGGALERMKALIAHDPENKEWNQTYIRALVLRASARVGAGKAAAAGADLALARPLLDASAYAEGADRFIRRDALDALALRIQLALLGADHGSAAVAANSLQALYKDKATLDSADEIGRYGLSELLLGMVAAQSGKPTDADSHYAAARRALAKPAHSSRFWRILDPWLRLTLLGGDADEATRVRQQLASYGYIPLFPWPAPAGHESNARSPAAAPAKQ
jgi:hypothetical protein